MPDRQDGTAMLWSFAALIRGVTVPDKHLPGLRARQMASMSRITGIILLSNVLNILAVVGVFLTRTNAFYLFIWAAFGLLIVGVAVFKHLQYLRIEPPRRNNRRALADYTRVSCLMGIIWGAAPLMMLRPDDPSGHMVMGIIAAGMMFAGGFLLSRIPLAAIIFIVPTALGMATALLAAPGPQHALMSVMVLYYLAVLLIAVLWTHRQFVDQYLGEAAIQEQSQLIGLLLRDFEESTSDLLWQTDGEGVLQDIPLIGEAGEPAWTGGGALRRGTAFTGMFRPGKARDALKRALAARQPFRDIVVPLKPKDGRECWWSVTGKPVIENGAFTGFRGVATDVTQSKEIEDRIARMAHFDALTGLPNRITMQEKLDAVLGSPLAPPACRALLLMDLDNFKWVNDTLGHPAGDELLRQMAGRLTSIAGDGDFMARLGGDEFAMIVERGDEEALEAFLDDLTAEMGRPYDIWGSSANCSASIGVRPFDPDTVDARIMMRHADLALYQAKHLGRAKWCMFSDELEERAQARLDIQEELQRAIEQNQLRVYFQPIVDAETHATVACETLVRWEHPERGLVFPGEFIEHAEENGLITRMGEWVIRAALAEAARLPEDMRISVNISPLQIHSATLVSTIVNAIAANGINPARLELEITETALMSNTDVTLRRLHQLRDLGISIALDDFGTGYSSLSYLRAFPFDRIKIDRSFVSDIEARADSQAITLATVNLAKSLGMRCTAEGVETHYQAEYLRQLGCDELQGFFVSRAQPLDHLGHLVDLAALAQPPSVEPTSANNGDRRVKSRAS